MIKIQILFKDENETHVGRIKSEVVPKIGETIWLSDVEETYKEYKVLDVAYTALNLDAGYNSPCDNVILYVEAII